MHRRARPTTMTVKTMMRSGEQFALTKCRLCWSVTLSFLFFLVFSSPHRVHHLYEQLPSATAHHISHADAHDHSDRNDRSPHDNQPASKPNDCVVLSVAQSAHVSLVSSFDLHVFETTVVRCANHPILSIKSLTTSPGSPRAPPRV